MKKLILLLCCNGIMAQGYFNGKELHCPTENSEAQRLFDGGIEVLHLNHQLKPKYLAATADIFARSVLQDTTFCDAYFFTGYTLNLLHQYRESYALLKMADTLAPKPILIYKQNLAAICLKVARYREARDNYQQIVLHFPESPEGYFGTGLTAPMLGDYTTGIENLDKAAALYPDYAIEQQHVMFVKGILLALNEQYDLAKPELEKVMKKYKKDDNFNIYYSLSLLKVATSNNDEKMKKEALKYYKKINDENSIPPDVKIRFVF